MVTCHPNGNLFFDIIRMQNFYYRQTTIWFNYTRDDEVVMYRYLKRSCKINEVINKGFSNILYINYKQTNDNILMNWTNNINDSTTIIIEKIQTYEYVWGKPK
jgi:hypothetical protein